MRNDFPNRKPCYMYNQSFCLNRIASVYCMRACYVNNMYVNCRHEKAILSFSKCKHSKQPQYYITNIQVSWWALKIINFRSRAI